MTKKKKKTTPKNKTKQKPCNHHRLLVSDRAHSRCAPRVSPASSDQGRAELHGYAARQTWV